MAKKRKKGMFKGKIARNSQKQQSGSQYGWLNLPKGVPLFKIEEAGRVSLDILPYVVKDPNHPDRDDEYEIATPGTLWYKRPYMLHRNIGPNKESIVCPGRNCPICAHRRELIEQGSGYDDDAVKALKPAMRNLYVVIPKGHKKYDEVPHIWDISQALFQQKLNEEIAENEDYETFPDLEEGYTLTIRFSEEQLGKNKYFDTSRIDFKPRREPYDESILDQIPCLDDVLVVLSPKAIEAIFYGDNTDAVEEDDDRPRHRRNRDEDDEDDRPTRRRSRDDDDENEEEDEEDEEDDRPRRRPAWDDDDDNDDDDDDRQPRRRRSKDEDDEEDEDDAKSNDDEEDEEDDRPPRRTRRPRDEVDEDEEDDDEEEEQPRRRQNRPGFAGKRKEAEDDWFAEEAEDDDVPFEHGGGAHSEGVPPPDQCPHGHDFGIDCDKFKDCDGCSVWEACFTAFRVQRRGRD